MGYNPQLSESYNVASGHMCKLYTSQKLHIYHVDTFARAAREAAYINACSPLPYKVRTPVVWAVHMFRPVQAADDSFSR